MYRLRHTLVHWHTLLLLVVAMISCFLAIHWNLRIKHNMALFSLIVSFPIVFSLQSAYKKRQTVLEYLSEFVATLIALRQTLLQEDKIPSERQAKAMQLIADWQTEFIHSLQTGKPHPSEILAGFSKVEMFIEGQSPPLSGKVMARFSKEVKEIYTCGYYLVSAKYHKTPRGIWLLSLIFTSLFPLFQATFLLEIFGDVIHPYAIFPVSLLTTLAIAFILRVQQQLEDPFVPTGADSIQFSLFNMIDAASSPAHHSVSK